MELTAEQAAALASHLQAFAETERADLARRLHDELGGLLTAAKMDLSWLLSRVSDDGLRQRLLQLGGVLDEAMNLKRRVVEDLRPSLLDHFGLPTAARAYIEAVCARSGLKFSVLAEQPCSALSRDAALALFRVLQEGLSNVIRHAEAGHVQLEVLGQEALCALVLIDDGCGFDAQLEGFRWGFGIASVRHRMHTLGGSLNIESRPGGGTTLRAQVPMTS